MPLHPQFFEKAAPHSGIWVTDPQAVAAKVQAYQQLGLAGVTVWQVGYEGTAATLSRALLSAVQGRALPDEVNAAPPIGNSPASPPLTLRSDWGSGYCADVQVRNPHTFSLLWQVSFTINDTIKTLWDAIYIQQGPQVIISGAVWNRLLLPGQSTVFGFCATRQQ